jgi:hypothetical protein
VEGKKSYLDGYRLKKFEIAPRFDLWIQHTVKNRNCFKVDYCRNLKSKKKNKKDKHV